MFQSLSQRSLMITSKDPEFQTHCLEIVNILRELNLHDKTQMQIDINHPHNLFLMLSAETGLITTLLFCGLLIWILITASQLLWNSQIIEPKNRLIFFSYLITFIGWILFNTVDITIFDINH